MRGSRIWAAVYRLSLRLYPRSLRDGWSDEMLRAFEDAYADHRRRGGWAAPVFAMRAVWDVMRSSRRERANREERRFAGRGTADLGLDVRIAWRSLVRTPLFTAAAVLVLALGIGANGALFSAMRATVLSKLPFPESGRLVLLDLTHASTTRPGDAPTPTSWSWRKFEILEETPGRLADPVAAYGMRTVTLTGDGDPVRLTVELVSVDYFEVLQVRPRVGRDFSSEDERENRLLAILSDGLWRERFGGDAGVIGRVVTLNGRPVEVIGVGAASFRGLTGQADMWLTIQTGAEVVAPFLVEEAYAHWLSVLGRIVPGATLEALQSQMQATGVAVEAAYPDSDPTAVRGGGARLLEQARVNRQARRAVIVLAAAAGLVLVIACANLAGLLLARGRQRERETAVRLALGGGRWRAARSALVESLLLAGLGGLAGGLVAWVLASWMVRVWPDRFLNGDGNIRFVEASAVQPDWALLAASAILALLTGVLCGIAPALAASRRAPALTLRAGSAALESRRGRADARSVLVAVELAAALVLLAGTGMMVASFARLQSVDRGMDTSNVLAFYWSLPRGSEWASRPYDFQATLLERLERVPGITSASVGCSIPLGGHCVISTVRQAGDRRYREGERPRIGVHYISQSYFETLGARLVAGRLPGDTDGRDSPPVVVLNRTAAQRLFPGEEAIGRHVGVAADPTSESPAQVIAVVDDILHGPPERGFMPEAYFSIRQAPFASVALVRTGVDPSALVPEIRAVMASIDESLPIFRLRTLEEMDAENTGDTRVLLMLLVAFGGLALVLAATGLWAIVAFAVSSRRREMGIRMTLGAEPGRVVTLVMGKAAAIVAAGLLTGGLGAWWLSRLLESLLYEVRRTDPAPFLAAATVLATVALLAAWLPARRATRVDPLETLRTD